MKYFILSLFLIVSGFSFGQIDSTRAIAEVRDNLDVDEVEEEKIGLATQEVRYDGNNELSVFVNKKMNTDIQLYLLKNNIRGNVTCTALINKNGEISDVQIYKGIDPFIDNEIIRVLKLTKWKPAYYHNKPIVRRVLIPVTL